MMLGSPPQTAISGEQKQATSLHFDPLPARDR
jgi:hypothetical protein